MRVCQRQLGAATATFRRNRSPKRTINMPSEGDDEVVVHRLEASNAAGITIPLPPPGTNGHVTLTVTFVRSVTCSSR